MANQAITLIHEPEHCTFDGASDTEIAAKFHIPYTERELVRLRELSVMKLIFLTVALSFNLWADSTLWQLNRAGISVKEVRVGPGLFSLEYVEGLARTELARSPHPNFMLLRMYGDMTGAPLPKPDHFGYQGWRSIYDGAKFPVELAELISIGKNAILRVRDASGKVNKFVLVGNDPLQIRIGEDMFEIIHMSFQSEVDVYVKTAGTFASDSGLQLLRILDAIFPDLRVSVYIRNDPWFIYQDSYPYVNYLTEYPPGPLTLEQYNQTRTLRCGHPPGSGACRIE